MTPRELTYPIECRRKDFDSTLGGSWAEREEIEDPHDLVSVLERCLEGEEYVFYIGGAVYYPSVDALFQIEFVPSQEPRGLLR